MISGHKGQSEGLIANAHFEKLVNRAVVHHFDWISRFLLPPTKWGIFEINNGDVVRASLSIGCVRLRMKFAAIKRPLEHNSRAGNLHTKHRP